MANSSLLPVAHLVLDDAGQIIEAIRTGCVDAFVMEEKDGHAVYTLHNADLPYSTLVQRMHDGAAMLNSSGHIIYANPRLAALLRTTSEALVGLLFQDFILAEDRPVFQELLSTLQNGDCEAELRVCGFDQAVIPVRLSVTALSGDKSVSGVLVSDITSERSYAELASSIQSLQDEERRTIARGLHDSVGQLLSGIAMNLARLQKGSAGLPSESTDILLDCANMVDQVNREIRTISHLLHPPLLDVVGLSSAIQWYVDGFAHRSNIKVEVDIDSDLGRLPEEIEICLFRIMQECLTNVYRHSGSDFCSIAVHRNAQFLSMEIRDTGHGIPKTADGQIPSGVGLRGMKERLRAFGGTLQINSTESGTAVIVSVPLLAKS